MVSNGCSYLLPSLYVCYVSASQDTGKIFSLLLIFSNLIIDALSTTVGPGGTEARNEAD